MISEFRLVFVVRLFEKLKSKHNQTLVKDAIGVHMSRRGNVMNV